MNRGFDMNFRVGQRVKVVKSPLGNGSEFLGRECIISSMKRYEKGTPCRKGPPLPVDTDCILLFPDGDESNAAFWQLEPIIPEGQKVVSWSECLWMPEHMRSKV